MSRAGFFRSCHTPCSFVPSGDCLTRDEDKATELAAESEADRKRALERVRAREAALAG